MQRNLISDSVDLRVGRGVSNLSFVVKPPRNFLLDQVSSSEVVGLRHGPLGQKVDAVNRLQRVAAIIRQNKLKTVWVALDTDVKTELAEFKCGAMINVNFEYRHAPEGDRGCELAKAHNPGANPNDCYVGWAIGELLNINTEQAYIPLDVACHLKSLMYSSSEGRFFDKDNPKTKFSRADLVVFYPDGGARHFNGRA